MCIRDSRGRGSRCGAGAEEGRRRRRRDKVRPSRQLFPTGPNVVILDITALDGVIAGRLDGHAADQGSLLAFGRKLEGHRDGIILRKGALDRAELHRRAAVHDGGQGVWVGHRAPDGRRLGGRGRKLSLIHI